MDNIYIFSGHAQLPTGSDLYENYKYVSIIATVDMNTGRIIECVVPVFCALSSNFVTEIIKGHSLEDGIEDIVVQIDKRVQMLSKRALINALQVIHNRYSIVKGKELDKEKS